MSAEPKKYGSKGAYFMGFIVFVILFVSLLIWVYSMNQNFLPTK